MRPVAQAKPQHHPLEHVLDRPLRIGQFRGDFAGLKPLRHEPDHVDLPLREPGQRHLTGSGADDRRAADRREDAAEQVRRRVHGTAISDLDRVHEPLC
jgi:hypothetical protein